jgi:hypothetical protein
MRHAVLPQFPLPITATRLRVAGGGEVLDWPVIGLSSLSLMLGRVAASEVISRLTSAVAMLKISWAIAVFLI